MDQENRSLLRRALSYHHLLQTNQVAMLDGRENVYLAEKVFRKSMLIPSIALEFFQGNNFSGVIVLCLRDYGSRDVSAR